MSSSFESSYKFPTQYQELIYTLTYARYLPDKHRRENFIETVTRYSNFFRPRVPQTLLPEWDDAIKSILKLEVMPSMRALWTAGPALERENLAGFNCAYLALNRIAAFSESLYVLMNGTGVGFSVERQEVNNLPEVPKELVSVDEVIVVEDSKEGWAKALDQYLHSLYAGRIPSVDLSLIRPKGAILKIFGGRASGPEPMQKLLAFVLKTFTEAKGRKLRSIECHDIGCYIASVVVSGGVRRSACISLSNRSDDRMAHAKDGDFYNRYPYRCYANNSIAYTEKPSAAEFMEDWLNLMRSESGERGIFNRQAAEHVLRHNGRRKILPNMGCNPCFRGDMRLLTVDGYKTFAELDGEMNVGVITPEGKVTYGPVWKTGVKETVRVKFLTPGFDDIICTPNHVFMLTNGVECQAKDLVNGGVKSIRTYKNDFAVVDSVSPEGSAEVYDFNAPDGHWGVVNGVVAHNCSEIILRDSEVCNLSEVVVRKDDTLDILKEKVRKATILGMLQSTLTKYQFVSDEWRKNIEEERLLGVSLTGLRDHPVLSKVSNDARAWLSAMKGEAISTASRWSTAMGINMPAAITCCKPSGTVSQLVDSASGLHPRFAPYYIRRVRVSTTDPMFKLLDAKGLHWEPDNGMPRETCTTAVFGFPIKAPEGSLCNDDVSAIEQLEHWKEIQEFYCEHKPSITVYVRDHEWIETGAWVYKNWEWVSGISFLPVSDMVYILPPYEAITKSQYETLKAEMPDIDFSELSKYEIMDETTGSREFACQGGACEIR